MKYSWVLLVLMIFCVSGCDEDAVLKVDEIAADVNTVTTAGEKIIDGPVGYLLPPQVVTIIKVAGAAAVALAGAWLDFRRRTYKTALSEVVKGCEKIPHTEDFKTAQSTVQSTGTKKLVAAIRAVI